MEIVIFASIPLITAFIGWLTNRVAIRMLFRPRRPVRIFGFTVQGLIPKRQKDIARKTAETIEREILSQNVLRKELEAIDFEEYISSFTRRVIHDKLGARIGGFPILRNLLNESTLARLADLAGQEMKKQAPYLKHRLSVEMEARLPIREMIEKRVESFDLEKLEELVTHIAEKELATIERLGAVLGFFIGLVQVLILLLNRSVS